jgi:hypothetical protein
MSNFFFCIFLLLLVSCNYNYHLGKKLEEQGKFEEASVEYSRAYLKSPSNEKYKTAFERNAVKTVAVLKDTYKQQIQNQNFFSAYTVLEQALRLNTQDSFFGAEQKKWYFVLLAGNIQFPKGREISGAVFGDKIYPVIQFQSPKSKRKIEAVIDINGDFFLEDLLYNPMDEDYVRYTIDTIGFKYLPFQNSNNDIVDEDSFAYFFLINFHTPKLTQHQGYFTDDNSAKKITLEKQNYWSPRRGITYTSRVENKGIIIESSSPEISFLPFAFFKKQQRIFLDFGSIRLKKQQGTFLWEIAQLSKSQIKQVLKNSYYYQVYQQTLDNSYFLSPR